MKEGGYPVEETAKGLTAAFPDSPTAELVQALIAAYGLPEITPAQLAALCFEFKLSGVDCAEMIIVHYPKISSEQMAIAMKDGGYPVEETAKGLKAAFPESPTAELIQALIAAYGLPEITPAQLAALCFEFKLSGVDCAEMIIVHYPEISSEQMAIAMKDGGYPVEETAKGLTAAFPESPTTELVQALGKAYGWPKPTVHQIARICFELNVSGTECAALILSQHPSTSCWEMAAAMKEGGYPVAETAKGLHAAYPNASAEELVYALVCAYGLPEITPLRIAKLCFELGQPGETCAALIIEYFPQTTCEDMALTMKKGGYPIEETAKGLIEAFPQSTPKERLDALVLAYGMPADSPTEIANLCYLIGLPGDDCGLEIIQSYPSLSPEDMAIAMKDGGYHEAETGKGLKAAYPTITAIELARALTAAYGND